MKGVTQGGRQGPRQHTPGYLILYRRWNEQNDQEKDGVHTLLKIHWPGDVTAHTRESIDVREDPKLSCSPFHITTTTNLFFFFYFVSEKPVGTFHISSTTANSICLFLGNDLLPCPTCQSTTTRAHKWNVTWVPACMCVVRSNVAGGLSISYGIHWGKINGPDRFSFFGTLATSLWFSNTRPSYNIPLQGDRNKKKNKKKDVGSIISFQLALLYVCNIPNNFQLSPPQSKF